MAETVEGVESERERDERLHRNLEEAGSSSPRRCDISECERVAKEGETHIADEATIEAKGKRDTGDTVETTQIPRKLRLVDLEMGRHGPVLALLDQNRLFVIPSNTIGGDATGHQTLLGREHERRGTHLGRNGAEGGCTENRQTTQHW